MYKAKTFSMRKEAEFSQKNEGAETFSVFFSPKFGLVNFDFTD